MIILLYNVISGQGRHRGVGGGAQGPGQRSLSYIILYYIMIVLLYNDYIII